LDIERELRAEAEARLREKQFGFEEESKYSHKDPGL
jgi:hypothetical protein